MIIPVAMAPRLLRLLLVVVALGAVAPATARAEYAEIAAAPVAATLSSRVPVAAVAVAVAIPRHPPARAAAPANPIRAPFVLRRYLLLGVLLV